MWRGIFALFFRSLRSDSRSIWVHLSWLFLLLVIYVSMIVAQEQSKYLGAPGLVFFRAVIYTNAVFMTLLGISYFSSAISEEKEEDTLGLMTMAGISPLGILLGKSTTRLFQVFLLLTVQYPFTLLSITLGGLVPDQIYAAYAALFAYTILLANAGLFCSVACRRNRDAAGLMTLFMFAYLVVPLFAYMGYHYFQFGAGAAHPRFIRYAPLLAPLLYWISQTTVFGQLGLVTETGYQFQLTQQLISNSIGGVFLFLVSWWLFGIVSHDPATEATTRAMVPRRTSVLRWFSAGRTWNTALIWKDFHFVTGGWFGFLTRCGLYTGMYWLSVASSYPWYQQPDLRQIDWRSVTWGFQFFVVPLFMADCAMCASRLFQEEIRHQTLAALMMLPRSVAYVVYSKVFGCLAGMIPGAVAVFVAFFMLTDSRSNLYEWIDKPIVWWVVANLLLMVHLCAMLSTYLRWGAFAMALALTGGSMFISTMILQAIYWRHMTEAKLGFLVVPVLLACACCHVVILLRLPALSER